MVHIVFRVRFLIGVYTNYFKILLLTHTVTSSRLHKVPILIQHRTMSSMLQQQRQQQAYIYIFQTFSYKLSWSFPFRAFLYSNYISNIPIKCIGFLQFLLGFSKVPLFFVSLCIFIKSLLTPRYRSGTIGRGSSQDHHTTYLNTAGTEKLHTFATAPCNKNKH